MFEGFSWLFYCIIINRFNTAIQPWNLSRYVDGFRCIAWKKIKK